MSSESEVPNPVVRRHDRHRHVHIRLGVLHLFGAFERADQTGHHDVEMIIPQLLDEPLCRSNRTNSMLTPRSRAN